MPKTVPSVGLSMPNAIVAPTGINWLLERIANGKAVLTKHWVTEMIIIFHFSCYKTGLNVVLVIF